MMLWSCCCQHFLGFPCHLRQIRICFAVTGQVCFREFSFATVFFRFSYPIKLLYCLVFRYQCLLCLCCHQHLRHIFFVIEDRYCSAREPAWFYRHSIVLLQFSFWYPCLSSYLFTILFPCISSPKDDTVASTFFVCSLSRRMDTSPQDCYQFVVPFVSTFASDFLRATLCVGFPVRSLLSWFKPGWNPCCQFFLSNSCSWERNQFRIGCLRLEKRCDFTFSSSFVSALGRFPSFSVRSSYLWLISQLRVSSDRLLPTFFAFSLSRRTDLMYSTHCEPDFVSISFLRAISCVVLLRRAGSQLFCILTII